MQDFNFGEALEAIFGAPTKLADGITAYGLTHKTAIADATGEPGTDAADATEVSDGGDAGSD